MAPAFTFANTINRFRSFRLINNLSIVAAVTAATYGDISMELARGHSHGVPTLAVLVLFCLQPEGFRHQQLRPLLAQFLGLKPQELTRGRMSYDLRRLRLHGLIERLKGTHRYRLTPAGLKVALFYSRTYQHVIRPGLSLLHEPQNLQASGLARSYHQFENQILTFLEQKRAA